MTTTHPSPFVEGPSTYDLLMTLMLWVVAMMNFKTLPTDLQSNGIWNGSQLRKKQDHDQQCKQHQYRYWHERPEIRGDDQFQVPGSNPVKRWHLLNRSLHQDCHSNGSNGQTKQDLAVQHHQLCKQVLALQVSHHLHPPLRL